MFLKKLAKTLLFPHISVLLLLLPFSSGALAVSFLFLEEKNPLRIASYAVSFYTLIAWCARVPGLVRSLRNWKDRNKYAQLWIQDARLRINVTLFGNSVWNSAYGFLQLGLGIYHRSFWFCSLAGYYFPWRSCEFFSPVTRRVTDREKKCEPSFGVTVPAASYSCSQTWRFPP